MKWYWRWLIMVGTVVWCGSVYIDQMTRVEAQEDDAEVAPGIYRETRQRNIQVFVNADVVALEGGAGAVDGSGTCRDAVVLADRAPLWRVAWSGQANTRFTVMVYRVPCNVYGLMGGAARADVRVASFRVNTAVDTARFRFDPTPVPSPTSTAVPVPAVALHWSAATVVVELGASQERAEIPALVGGLGPYEVDVACAGGRSEGVIAGTNELLVPLGWGIGTAVACNLEAADRTGDVAGMLVFITRASLGGVRSYAFTTGSYSGMVVEPVIRGGGSAGRGLLLELEQGTRWLGPWRLVEILHDIAEELGWPVDAKGTVAMMLAGVLFAVWYWLPPQMGPWRMAVVVTVLVVLPVMTPLGQAPLLLSAAWSGIVLVWQGRSVWQGALPRMFPSQGPRVDPEMMRMRDEALGVRAGQLRIQLDALRLRERETNARPHLQRARQLEGEIAAIERQRQMRSADQYRQAEFERRMMLGEASGQRQRARMSHQHDLIQGGYMRRYAKDPDNPQIGELQQFMRRLTREDDTAADVMNRLARRMGRSGEYVDTETGEIVEENGQQ